MHSLAQRWRWPTALIALLGVTVLVGCGPSKPQLYSVRGRVVDAATRQGVVQAKLLLRALLVEANKEGLAASATLMAYGFTEADGTYSVELSQGFDVLRRASAIRLEASAPGYGTATMDVPAPTKKEEFYKLPDILMVRAVASPWAVPKATP
jgi:hypothetical protein